MKISSDSVTGLAKAFFAVPFLMLLFMILMSTIGVIVGRDIFYTPLIPLAVLIIISWLYVKFVWNLADEVFDEGDAFLIKRGKIAERVFLSEILFLNNRIYDRVPKIGIETMKSFEFGFKIYFVPDCADTNFKNTKDLFLDLSRRVTMAKSI